MMAASIFDDHDVLITRGDVQDQADVRRLLAVASLPTDGIESLDVLLVARAGGRVVGGAGLELYPPQALLRSVVVDTGARSHGVGERLVHAALREAGLAGSVEVFLLTLDADAYFERFGFRQVERDGISGPVLKSREFTQLCPSSATAMLLRTPPADGG